jgi:aminopeptidase N
MLLKTGLLFLLTAMAAAVAAQPLTFTRQDTLRGSIGPGRAWWDVVYYDLKVTPDIVKETLEGSNTIRFKTGKAGKRMQVDLQEPMQITKVLYKNKPVKFVREGNAFFITLPVMLAAGKTESITVHFKGVPRKAVNAPWDGGIVWKKDKLGRPFISTACQGLGASVWWPTKDHQSDEPDSMQFAVTVPDTLVDASNGRLRSVKKIPGKKAVYTWFISNPINNYNITMNIGKYVHWADTLAGEKGKLSLDYYVLDYNKDKAQAQFAQVKPMLQCFESWFGPYPFYEDGYKLVETHHLGMEHQSAVAYGNGFRNGYRGSDLSGSGWGLKWDFIIVHETGHEWFGNNITTNDLADMWVHESFTNYSETLHTECLFGKEAGHAYNRGIRKNIRNDKPIIGVYGVNMEGSGDMYYKGGNLLHTIRQAIDNDALFRQILRGLNREFYHKTVNGSQVEAYMSKQAGFDFSKVFDQYLRDVRIPNLMFMNTVVNGKLHYKLKWGNCVDGFNLPVIMQLDKDKTIKVYPNTQEYINVPTELPENLPEMEGVFDRNIYITVAKVDVEN